MYKLLILIVLFSSCTVTKKVVKTQEFKGCAILVTGAVVLKCIKFKKE